MFDNQTPMTLQRFCPHCSCELSPPAILSWGGWTFDESKGELLPSKLWFAPSPSRVLGALFRAEGRPVTREAIYGVICGGKPDVDWPDQQIAQVVVSKLRARLRREGVQQFIGNKTGHGWFVVEQGKGDFPVVARGRYARGHDGRSAP